MRAFVRAIEYYLPEQSLTNAILAEEFPDWTVDKIQKKTGIEVRHIARENECASDLGVRAAENLFASAICLPRDIDYVLFCTQSPDYFLPSTSCLIQDRLAIPKSAGAIDFNQGCSGYIYGLGLASGLIETDQARTVLLITAETYSKHICRADRSVRSLFGDAAAATLVIGRESDSAGIGPFIYGTDGSGAKNLIVPTGGMRNKRTETTAQIHQDENGNFRSNDNLYMNGAEIFNFTLNTVPQLVAQILKKANRAIEDIDLFVFHQANKFMLEHLQKKLRIPAEKFYMSFSNYGNTVSSTIPIALRDASSAGKLESGAVVMLVGFGVGYSWGASIIRWM
jgi:3-oxoacyl-[acyl-carrier-protein] synthase-3